MADDERRVETRPAMVGRGLGATPERIADLQQRARAHERLRRPPPVKTFAEVLSRDAAARAAEEAEEELGDKEKRRRALPKKGPRPGLVHPSQRDTHGRDEAAEETVVLKG